jgi:hypothetical protein
MAARDVRVAGRLVFQSAIGNLKSKILKVALFITCLTDQFYPHVGVAVTKILEHFGCEVSFPQAQTCCGQPFYNNGYHDEARELARRWVESGSPMEIGSRFEVVALAGDVAVIHWAVTLGSSEMDGVLIVTLDSEGRCREHREWYAERSLA